MTVTIELPDAHIVATMRVYGMRHLLTFNANDFKRFESVEIIVPASVTLDIEPDLPRGAAESPRNSRAVSPCYPKEVSTPPCGAPHSS